MSVNTQRNEHINSKVNRKKPKTQFKSHRIEQLAAQLYTLRINSDFYHELIHAAFMY